MAIGVYLHKPRESWVKEKISKSMKGKKPKNFDLFFSKSMFVKGHPQSNTGRTHFKTGFIPWNKGIKRPEMSGENHFAWKGGTYDKDRKIDMGRKNYRVWRKAVFERDGYKCIWCGSVSDLNADHIKPYSTFPELRYAIDNGRTLCETCHKLTGTYGGQLRKENNNVCLRN